MSNARVQVVGRPAPTTSHLDTAGGPMKVWLVSNAQPTMGVPFRDVASKVSAPSLANTSGLFNTEASSNSLGLGSWSPEIHRSAQFNTCHVDSIPTHFNDITLPQSVENEALDGIDLDDLLNAICPIQESNYDDDDDDNTTNRESAMQCGGAHPDHSLLTSLDSWLHPSADQPDAAVVEDAGSSYSLSPNFPLPDINFDVNSFFTSDSIFLKSPTRNEVSDCPIPAKRMCLSTPNDIYHAQNIVTTPSSTSSSCDLTYQTIFHKTKERQKKNNEASRKSRAMKRKRIGEMQKTIDVLHENNIALEAKLQHLSSLVDQSKNLLVNHFHAVKHK